MNQKEILTTLEQFQEKFGHTYADCAAIVLPNIPLGCSWGLITKPQARGLGIDEKTKVESGQIFKLDSGYLVYLDTATLLERLSQQINLFTPEVMNAASKRTQIDLAKLKKLVEKGGNHRLAFCSVNESPNLTINGKVYPSFNISPVDFLSTLASLGRGVMVQGQLVPAQQLVQNPEVLLSVCPLAPSGNGLLAIVG